jgi:RimJ/RimL family protein N-acetyltransferase
MRSAQDLVGPTLACAREKGVQHLSTPEIRTERLVLTPLCGSDAQALFDYRSSPDVCRYQTWEPRSIDDARRFVDACQAVPFDTPGSWSQLGIRCQDSGVFVGDLGVRCPADEPRQAEIGFTISPSHQRRGLGLEAVAGLLAHLFGPLQKHRVFASVDPRNEPSMALLRRVGMRQEAHFRESLWFKGDWADDAVFAILASEWSSR